MVQELVAISSAGARLGALLGVLSLALGLVGLPGDLLHHVGALLPGHGDALPSSRVGTLLLVNVLGHGGGSVLADFLGPVTAHLTRSADIIANLEQEKTIILRISKQKDNNAILPVWRLGCTSGW